MTTLLSRPLSREVLLDGAPFKVMISPTGVTITKKGRRAGKEVGWDNVLALSDITSPHLQRAVRATPTDLPEPIAADTARQIKTAKDALQRAAEILARAGSLPATVLSSVEPDPVYGRIEHESDWFIEPLLTADELASILRISTRSAADLPVPHMLIRGERRYRQSEVRRYLIDQQTNVSSIARRQR